MSRGGYYHVADVSESSVSSHLSSTVSVSPAAISSRTRSTPKPTSGSSSTPSSLKPHQPLSATQQGPANRIQKSGSNKNSGPLNTTQKSRLNKSNITEASPNVIKLGTSIHMADVKIKEEIKSESENEVVLRSDNNTPLTAEALKKYPPALQQLLYYRYRLQQITKAANKAGGLASQDAIEVQQILKVLSSYPWVEGHYSQSKIGKAVRLIGGPNIYGDLISSRAEQLWTRWRAGDFTPVVFSDDADALVESDEDYETSDSKDDRVAPRPSVPSSHREKVDDCVARHKRGMIITRAKNKKSYTLDPKVVKKPADKFGHNGLTVGDWWPFQSFALKDGAHGHKMGGIYGKIKEGAYSVVVSGGTYDDNDFDSGDRILYSGSKGGESAEDATEVAPYTTATQCLITSARSNKPVRVLRSSRCASRYAPSAGIRYDGLYDVQSYSIQIDKSGKKFYQFVLVREPNQPAIDRSRPTPVEVAALDIIRAI